MKVEGGGDFRVSAAIGAFFLAAVLLAPPLARAAVGGAEYLTEGAGARWLGLGGAARAAARDAMSGYWNPAGLTAQGPSEWQAGSMLTFTTLGRRTSWLSGSLLTDRYGAWGAGWMRRTVDGLERVDDQGNVSENSASAEDALLVSFAQAPFYRLRWGVTVKGLRQQLFDFTGYGGSVDAGILLQPFLGREFHVALTAENMASSFAWNTGARDRLPRAFGAGLAAKFLGDSLLVAADAVSREGKTSPEIHAGGEYWVHETAAIRAGVDDLRPAAGATYFWKPYQVDYAFTWDENGLGSRHQVSFMLVF